MQDCGLEENIINDFKDGISHGILVGNLTYALAKRLGMSEDEAYELKLAGMIHDVGKLKLSPYLYGRNSDGLSIEEMKYMRMHSKIGYEYLKRYDFSSLSTTSYLSSTSFSRFFRYGYENGAVSPRMF